MTLADTSNGPDWIVWAVVILIAILSAALLSGHGSWLIAGYNTASEKERADWSHFLKEKDLKDYTPEAVIGPSEAPAATTSPEQQGWYFKVF